MGDSDSPVLAPAEVDVEQADETPASSEDRSSLLKIIGSAVGIDLTTMALPVYYNEPLTMLQRLCEFMQYSHLLDLVRYNDKFCCQLLTQVKG